MVPVGTLLSELLEYSGETDWVPDVGFRVIAGGHDRPGGGRSSGSVLKTTAGLVTLPPPTLEERNCIRCGACARVCPRDSCPSPSTSRHVDAIAVARIIREPVYCLWLLFLYLPCKTVSGHPDIAWPGAA